MYLDKQILPNIYAFRPNRETLGGTAYAIVTGSSSDDPASKARPENVLVDCPAATEEVCHRLEELGGVKWLVLTHRTAMGQPGSNNACVAKLVQKFSCQVVVQEQEAYLLPQLPVRSFGDELELAPELQLIWTPGHTPGSSCLLYCQAGGVLFTGRHLLPNDEGELVPLKQATTFHWSRQLSSIDLLLQRIEPPAPEWICPGANLGKLRGDKIMDDGRKRLQMASSLSQQPLP